MAGKVLFPQKINSMGELVYNLVQPDEYNEVFEFLCVHFFPVVPVSRGVNVDLEVRPWANDFISEILKQGRSLTVRDPSNGDQLIAVGIFRVEEKSSTPGTPGTESWDHWADADQRPLTTMISAFLEVLDKDIDLFTNYDVTRLMEVTIRAVNEQYASRGIASKMLELAIEKARVEDGIRVFKTQAVNEYAARSAARAGFVTIREIAYQDFEYKGTKPFSSLVETVHKRGRLMVLSL